MVGQQILSLLQGDPASQLGQTLNPNPVNPSPNPSPGAPQGPQGGPPASGGAQPPPAPSMAPATATQSPPDLAALYTQLHSQDVRGAQMDKGLALMASAFGTGQQQHDMMNYAAGIQPDDRAGQIGNMLKDQAAATQLRNEAQFRAGAAGQAGQFGVDPSTMSWLANDPEAMHQFMSAQNQTKSALNLDKGKDLIEAQSKAPGALAMMQDMDQRASTIGSTIDPATGSPVMQGILNSPIKKAAATSIINNKDEGWFSSAEGSLAQSRLTPAEQAAISNLRQLNGQVYGEAFTSTGSRRTQAEVQNLKAGLSPLLNFNQSYEDYMKQYGDFQKTLHTSIANTYGSAQDLDNPALTPYRNLVSPTYLPGQKDKDGNSIRGAGSLYAGGGGSWASDPNFKSGAPTQVAGVATVASPAEAQKLPSGTKFVIPDGPRKGQIAQVP